MIRNGDTLCLLCGVEEETWSHLVFGCEESYGLRPWNWTSWAEMDDRQGWQYTMEGERGEVVVQDKVEDFFVALDRALVGARVRYSTTLPHLLLFIIFFISHGYYICYFLLSMYGHQGNAGTLSHVICVNYQKW